MAKMLAYRATSSVFVVAHGTENPTDEEWVEYLKYYREETASLTKILVVTDGGGPTTSQRAAMNEQIDGKPTVSICTDSRILRGVITAVSWFNSNVRAFQRDDLEGALEYLELGPSEVTEVLGTVDELLHDLNEG